MKIRNVYMILVDGKPVSWNTNLNEIYKIYEEYDNAQLFMLMESKNE